MVPSARPIAPRRLGALKRVERLALKAPKPVGRDAELARHFCDAQMTSSFVHAASASLSVGVVDGRELLEGMPETPPKRSAASLRPGSSEPMDPWGRRVPWRPPLENQALQDSRKRSKSFGSTCLNLLAIQRHYFARVGL